MDYIEQVIIRNKNRGIILDTNLLILYIVGNYNIDYIKEFKRTASKGYTEDDFLALSKILNIFNKVFLTPHVLSELSNLTFNYKNEENKNFTEYLLIAKRVLENINENNISKNNILSSKFLKFGFTDISILELAINNSLPVITDDLPFYSLLNNQGVECINMSHIRVYK